VEVHGNVHVLDIAVLVKQPADVVNAASKGERRKDGGRVGREETVSVERSRTIDSSSIESRKHT